MKRSPALISLSRNHHKALAVALRLRRADDPTEAAEQFLEFWRSSGAEHFRVEEEVLLPQWGQLGKIDEQAASRLAREHLEIRIQALAAEQRPTLDQLQELGRNLAEHVRFEERELFERLEADLSEKQLKLLADAVAVAEEESPNR